MCFDLSGLFIVGPVLHRLIFHLPPDLHLVFFFFFFFLFRLFLKWQPYHVRSHTGWILVCTPQTNPLLSPSLA